MCTQNGAHLFGEFINSILTVNAAGEMIAERLLNIQNLSGITIDKYIVMPNHLHAIILISNSGTTQGSFPTISELLRRLKTITTKLYVDGMKKGLFLPFDKNVWQKSFYDHIIRYETEYQKIWQYIDENPMKWTEDKYYCDNG